MIAPESLPDKNYIHTIDQSMYELSGIMLFMHNPVMQGNPGFCTLLMNCPDINSRVQLYPDRSLPVKVVRANYYFKKPVLFFRTYYNFIGGVVGGLIGSPSPPPPRTADISSFVKENAARNSRSFFTSCVFIIFSFLVFIDTFLGNCFTYIRTRNINFVTKKNQKNLKKNVCGYMSIN